MDSSFYFQKFVDMDTYQGYPLHLAVETNEEKLVSTLLDNNVDINLTGPSGNTALHVAISYRRLHIMTLLLGKNPDVNVINNFGFTPLHLAVKVGCLDSVKVLIIRGADVRQKENYGRTALHLNSIYTQNREIANILLLHGAHIDAQDYNGQTALNLAVGSPIIDYRGFEHTTLMKELLEWGASMFMEDMKCTAPIRLAYKTKVAKCIFGNHMYQLACLGLFDTKKNMIHYFNMCPELYWSSSCLQEAKKMKTFPLRVSELFSKQYDPAFLQNSEVTDALKSYLKSTSINYEFPIYSSFIKVMFKKCQQRLSLLEKAQNLHWFCFNTLFPEEITRIILSYLDDEDLRRVIEADQEQF